MNILAVAKIIVILHCFAIGTFLIVTGAKGTTESVKLGDFEAYNIPAGVMLYLVALAIGVFWKVEYKTKTTTRTQKISPDGASITTNRTQSSDARFMPADNPKK